MKRLLPLFAIILIAAQPAMANLVRIRDLAYLRGARENQLIGYGLVVGLEGTGDQGSSTMQTISNMLNNFGITIDQRNIKTKNTAAVIVTATLPPFASPGSKLDVTVSSFAGAKSLQGGTLLQTPLAAANNEVYAVAQGAISIGGFNVGSGGSSKVQKNHITVATIPNGSIVEKGVDSQVMERGSIHLLLKQYDYTTSNRIVTAINNHFRINCAVASDGGTITVYVPRQHLDNIVPFIAELEVLAVEPNSEARVIINERTGTVVITQDVTISTVAVSHGDLSITIREDTTVSQPPSLSAGETVTTTQRQNIVTEAQMKLVLLKGGVNIEKVVKILNALKVTPRDMIAIFQAIKKAGALHAELILL